MYLRYTTLNVLYSFQNELSQNMSFLNQRQAGRAHETRQRMSGNELKKT